jgi:ATP-dependent DNA helicase RecG
LLIFKDIQLSICEKEAAYRGRGARLMSVYRKRIFISSVQKELQAERRAIRDFVQNDPLLRRFFEVFLFEDLPAADRRADAVYLEEVGRCNLYVGLFADEYGYEDAAGLSATEREFDQATAQGKPRLIFVRGSDDKARHPRILKLIQKAGGQLIRRRFGDIPDLTAALYTALVEHLERSGDLRTLPFDASACEQATMDDLSEEKLRWFLGTARRERQYILSENTSAKTALTHMNLLDRDRPAHAAILLFGKEPQRFLITSEVKCLHFHGTEVRKPIPSYQIYKGTVFELVDQSVDFVLSKINRHIGTREYSVQAPAEYELPQEAVREAIVNAVAHRDYTSNASVQIVLFADRLEVWNPGELPPPLTPKLLRQPHASIPRNPLIAEPLYLVRYIEKAGTGTLDMIDRCRSAALPEPDFEQRAGQWVVTLWRDWLTADVLAGLGLNERQIKAVAHVKVHGRITNKEYQGLTGLTNRTVLRELKDLLDKGVLERIGETGRGTYYVLTKKTRH